MNLDRVVKGVRRVQVDFPDTEPGSVSMTKQAPKNEVDINTIMRRALKTGVIPLVDSEAFYGDFSGVTDFKSLQDRMLRVNQGFASLSADVRRRFDNNPELLFDFLSDKSNYDEAVKLGLIKKKAESTVVPAAPGAPASPVGAAEAPAVK